VAAQERTDAAGIFTLVAPVAGTYQLLLFPPAGGSFAAPAVTLDSAAYVEREIHIAGDTGRAPALFLDREVDQRAFPRGGTRSPSYPPDQRDRGIRGRVTLFFVVGEEGLVDTASVQFLSGSDTAFVAAVRPVITRLRYSPAQRGGRPVRQVAWTTIDFGCEGDPPVGDMVIRTMSPGCRR
jgi:TonB family protein